MPFSTLQSRVSIIGSCQTFNVSIVTFFGNNGRFAMIALCLSA